MNNSVPSAYLPLLDAWKAPQVGLPEVVRWKKYIDKDQGARLQNSLQHSHAITLLGAMMVGQLHPYVQLDSGLLMTALAVHDVGEGEIGKDTLYIDKSTAGDLDEYLAFQRRYEPLGESAFNVLHRAFLLQFALKNPESFPPRARALMCKLAVTNRLEALAFDAVERWDYVLYALEQYRERGNEKILVQTLRHQIGHLNRLSDDLPGFSQAICKKESSVWSAEFLGSHRGKWEERKGEV